MAAEYQVRVPLVTLASTGFFPHLAGMFRMSIFVCLLLSLGLAQAAPRKKKATASTIPKAVPVEMPSAEGKPNILLIIVDDLNDWVGWLGGHPQARTPNMDRLAMSGMRFANAHTAYALCNPSRTALMTGLMPSSSGVFGNEQDWRRSVQMAGKPTMPDFFRAMGYATAAGGKVFHANHGGPEARLTGWHGGRRGFESEGLWMKRFPEQGVQLVESPVHPGQNFNGLDIWHWDWGGIDVTDEQTEDGQTVAWAADYISKHKTKQPFFMTVGLYKPHSPWYAPKAYLDERPLDQVKLPEVKADDLEDVPAVAKTHVGKGEDNHGKIVAKDLWTSAVRAYLANITFADAQLGKLLDALERSPAAKNTIIALTSDHGWYLGEKQMWHKGKLWERATHVPLTIYAPTVTHAGSVSGEPVSLIDLYPTLADLAGLAKPAHLDGESLMPLLSDPSAKRARPAITVMGGEDKVSYAARSDRWRYIRYADQSEELYDHQSDPNEWTNLASKAELAPIKQALAGFFPKTWNKAYRPADQLGRVQVEDGSLLYALMPGDKLAGSDAPPILNRAFSVEAMFDYVPAIDQDSSLIHQGDAENGWVLHLVEGRPTFTVNVNGVRTSLSTNALTAGPAFVQAMIPGNGTMALSVRGVSEIIDRAPFPAGFPVQPDLGLEAAASFGPLKNREFPNSTPFDGPMQRLELTVLSPN
jgi:arylsulfatase A-like enzyme